MSESLRKKIVFASLPLAVIWAIFNYPSKPPSPPAPTAAETPPPLVATPTPVKSPPESINIAQARREPWGPDPFRTYTYRSATRGSAGAISPGWTLAGIIYSRNKPMAFVNSRMVAVGDRIGSATVVAIDKESVTLEHQGRRIRLTLNRG